MAHPAHCWCPDCLARVVDRFDAFAPDVHPPHCSCWPCLNWRMALADDRERLIDEARD